MGFSSGDGLTAYHEIAQSNLGEDSEYHCLNFVSSNHSHTLIFLFNLYAVRATKRLVWQSLIALVLTMLNLPSIQLQCRALTGRVSTQVSSAARGV